MYEKERSISVAEIEIKKLNLKNNKKRPCLKKSRPEGRRDSSAPRNGERRNRQNKFVPGPWSDYTGDWRL